MTSSSGNTTKSYGSSDSEDIEAQHQQHQNIRQKERKHRKDRYSPKKYKDDEEDNHKKEQKQDYRQNETLRPQSNHKVLHRKQQSEQKVKSSKQKTASTSGLEIQQQQQTPKKKVVTFKSNINNHIQNCQVDVHACSSNTCETCTCKKEVQFIPAKPLEPKMVNKLRTAPQWWDIGESFYDLYQQAQERAANKKKIQQQYKEENNKENYSVDEFSDRAKRHTKRQKQHY
jgi:hypothetical protein